MIKVLMLASEIEGLVKTGGLADIARALPEALINKGVDVRVLVPYYKQHMPAGLPIEIPALDVSLSMSNRYGVSVRSTTIGNIPVYLVEHDEFFDRSGIYDNGKYPYEDNALRFGLLSKTAFNMCEAMNWFPDILHCNDWQTALAPYYLKTHVTGHRGFNNTKSLLTIHNGFFQGRIPNPYRHAIGIMEPHYSSEFFEDFEMVNLLKGGIMFADAVNAVSPGYRDELLSERDSHGMWRSYKLKEQHFYGILNGCDYQQWSPETDPLIPASYSPEDLSGKADCKAALQRQMGLDIDPDVPVFGLVSRVAQQKGFQYLIPALHNLMVLEKKKVQIVMLGSGDQKLVDDLIMLEQDYGTKIRFHQGYNNSMAHLIEAGSDYFLMPSLFEPCGLNQIYSLKYGTLPIVRSTGGLIDTVNSLTANHSNIKSATGLAFKEPNVHDCLEAIQKAVKLWYQHPDKYKIIQQNAMKQDFSWEKPAEAYLKLYKQLINS